MLFVLPSTGGRDLGFTSMAVSQVVANSSALYRLEHAIYGIRGRALSPEALAQARKRRMAELADSQPGAALALQDVDLSRPISTVVTQSASTVAASKRVVYLPGYLSGKVEGVFSHKDGSLPDINVRPNNQIRRLSMIAESLGVGPGERFEVVFDVPGRTYAVPGAKRGEG